MRHRLGAAVLVALLASSIPARAFGAVGDGAAAPPRGPTPQEPRFALLVGPSLLSSDLAGDLGRDRVLANGFVIEAAVRVQRSVHLIVELARHAERLSGYPLVNGTASQATLLIGLGFRPRFAGVWRPVAQISAGRATASADVRVDLPFVGSLPVIANGFAAMIGVGAERRLGDGWAWRVAQLDLVVTDYYDANVDVRLTSGVSLRF